MIIAIHTDNLDLKACRRHGVPVANVPGYSTSVSYTHIAEVPRKSGLRGELPGPDGLCAVPVSYTHLDVYKRQRQW